MSNNTMQPFDRSPSHYIQENLKHSFSDEQIKNALNEYIPKNKLQKRIVTIKNTINSSDFKGDRKYYQRSMAKKISHSIKSFFGIKSTYISYGDYNPLTKELAFMFIQLNNFEKEMYELEKNINGKKEEIDEKTDPNEKKTANNELTNLIKGKKKLLDDWSQLKNDIEEINKDLKNISFKYKAKRIAGMKSYSSITDKLKNTNNCVHRINAFINKNNIIIENKEETVGKQPATSPQKENPVTDILTTAIKNVPNQISNFVESIVDPDRATKKNIIHSVGGIDSSTKEKLNKGINKLNEADTKIVKEHLKKYNGERNAGFLPKSYIEETDKCLIDLLLSRVTVENNDMQSIETSINELISHMNNINEGWEIAIDADVQVSLHKQLHNYGKEYLKEKLYQENKLPTFTGTTRHQQIEMVAPTIAKAEGLNSELLKKLLLSNVNPNEQLADEQLSERLEQLPHLVALVKELESKFPENKELVYEIVTPMLDSFFVPLLENHPNEIGKINKLMRNVIDYAQSFKTGGENPLKRAFPPSIAASTFCSIIEEYKNKEKKEGTGKFNRLEALEALTILLDTAATGKTIDVVDKTFLLFENILSSEKRKPIQQDATDKLRSYFSGTIAAQIEKSKIENNPEMLKSFIDINIAEEHREQFEKLFDSMSMSPDSKNGAFLLLRKFIAFRDSEWLAFTTKERADKQFLNKLTEIVGEIAKIEGALNSVLTMKRAKADAEKQPLSDDDIRAHLNEVLGEIQSKDIAVEEVISRCNELPQAEKKSINNSQLFIERGNNLFKEFRKGAIKQKLEEIKEFSPDLHDYAYEYVQQQREKSIEQAEEKIEKNFSGEAYDHAVKEAVDSHNLSKGNVALDEPLLDLLRQDNIGVMVKLIDPISQKSGIDKEIIFSFLCSEPRKGENQETAFKQRIEIIKKLQTYAESPQLRDRDDSQFILKLFEQMDCNSLLEMEKDPKKFGNLTKNIKRILQNGKNTGYSEELLFQSMKEITKRRKETIRKEEATLLNSIKETKFFFSSNLLEQGTVSSESRANIRTILMKEDLKNHLKSLPQDNAAIPDDTALSSQEEEIREKENLVDYLFAFIKIKNDKTTPNQKEYLTNMVEFAWDLKTEKKLTSREIALTLQFGFLHQLRKLKVENKGEKIDVNNLVNVKLNKEIFEEFISTSKKEGEKEKLPPIALMAMPLAFDFLSCWISHSLPPEKREEAKEDLKKMNKVVEKAGGNAKKQFKELTGDDDTSAQNAQMSLVQSLQGFVSNGGSMLTTISNNPTAISQTLEEISRKDFEYANPKHLTIQLVSKGIPIGVALAISKNIATINKARTINKEYRLGQLENPDLHLEEIIEELTNDPMMIALLIYLPKIIEAIETHQKSLGLAGKAASTLAPLATVPIIKNVAEFFIKKSIEKSLTGRRKKLPLPVKEGEINVLADGGAEFIVTLIPLINHLVKDLNVTAYIERIAKLNEHIQEPRNVDNKDIALSIYGLLDQLANDFSPYAEALGPAMNDVVQKTKVTAQQGTAHLTG